MQYQPIPSTRRVRVCASCHAGSRCCRSVAFARRRRRGHPGPRVTLPLSLSGVGSVRAAARMHPCLCGGIHMAESLNRDLRFLLALGFALLRFTVTLHSPTQPTCVATGPQQRARRTSEAQGAPLMTEISAIYGSSSTRILVSEGACHEDHRKMIVFNRSSGALLRLLLPLLAAALVARIARVGLLGVRRQMKCVR